ncbi:S1 RNA-binding domain-containing protein [Candidatus Epulonipiscium viviparus]|uniref:CvfB family protein n=1 Tax=Candidatus Epulonipiscium viviparus TaxID=420336 RepID=UPI0027381255|nr:S1-like domain-containing RNA-binding protein [Candidatus Epulopiscium viviparus]
MIELGIIQELTVVETSDFGLYLGELPYDPAISEKILLPNSEVAEEMKLGDTVSVFVYKDTKDRPVATLKRPAIVLGEIAPLEVLEVTNIGAFLNWGLIKDLFLPFKEQTVKVRAGKTYVVGLYVDKTERLCATMKVYNLLQNASALEVNKTTKGLVYQVSDEYGIFVAVEGKYHGLIPKREIYQNYQVGEWIDVRVTRVRPDGKLELSVRKQINGQMEVDAKKLLDAIHAQKGFLNLHDKSSPIEIKNCLNMSKASFKRAVGRLLKEGVIELKPNGIQSRIYQ